jgi:phosphatidylserine decarboxylase
MAMFVSRLFLLLQYMLPKRLLTAVVYHLTRVRVVAVKDLLIRGFLKLYPVDLDEIPRSVPGDFECFNDFFIRELEEGSRPTDPSLSAIVSPADGFVSAVGCIDRNSVIQAKGIHYSLEELLATDLDEAGIYYDGSFATIYLAPFNYHRVHAPLAGELVAARFVPGSLFSVNQTTTSSVRGLFTRNERLICHFRSDIASWVLIFVGALNVGSITTRWTGELRPRKGNVVQNIDLNQTGESKTVTKGEVLGWFNMGSTVILLMPPQVCEWRPALNTEDVLRTGEAIGQIVE